MPFAVLPAQICDVEPVYDVYFAAFKNEPIIEFLFPGGGDRKAHTAGTVQWWNHDRNGYTVKCVDTDTGKIVGMASWDIFWRPGEEGAWPKPDGAVWLEGEQRTKAEGVLVPLWEMHEKLFGKNRHVYLPTMAVDPDCQRRGAGRLLMQWGIDIAEKLGLAIYLESTEAGLPLYSRMGFERLTYVHMIHKAEVAGTEEDVEVPLMVKMPSKAKGMAFEDWAKRGYP
ncbi:Uu.00g075880.m01.CDS01 [Anthostomella pinea]|uniref:Uu.00g075880.m01.CDS01 n=1 Tax=Anthostomella pinea TaxID=933095 RepID=A0AAI8VVT3_9PEZI|nr:Uu.00g075880.m01.CDS01 [Anthostomella pinea]